MKTLLIACLLFINIGTWAQGYGEENDTIEVKKDSPVKLPKDDKGKICYSEVIDAPNISKTALYNNASEWFALAFKSAKDVIQLNDKEAGKIIGKGTVIYYNKVGRKSYPDRAHFTIEISVKDNKYKYVISNIYLSDAIELKEETPDISMLTDDRWHNIVKDVNFRIEATILDLKKGMLNTTKNEW